MSSKIFTSYLNVNDFLLAKADNYKVIKAIQSVSKQKIALFKSIEWRMLTSNLITLGFDSYSGELEAYEAIFNEALSQNIAQLKKEAQSLGANAVIDIKIVIDWQNTKILNISIFGNAAQLGEFNKNYDNEFFLSTLNLNDTYKLIKNGYLPKEILFVFTNFLIRPRYFKYLLAQNKENKDVSQDINNIRQKSLEKFQHVAHKSDIEGVVGLDLKINISNYTFRPESPSRIQLIHQIMGTGIKCINDNKKLMVNPVLNLSTQIEKQYNSTINQLII